MASLLPPEIWSEVFWHACTDTGITGCSISLVCRYFYDISKPIKLRSVAIEGIPRAISFLGKAEALPTNQRAVENFYLSLYDPLESVEDMKDPFSEVNAKINAQLLGNYKHDTNLEKLNNFHPPEALRMHLVLRLLAAFAHSLEYVSVSFGHYPMTHPFLPIQLPKLVELDISGVCVDTELFLPTQLPTLTNLRRVRISCRYTPVTDNTLDLLPSYAPNLTHLLIEERYATYSVKLFSQQVARLLKLSSTASESSESGHGDNTGLPYLERLLIKEDEESAREMSALQRALRRRGVRILEKLVQLDARVFLFEPVEPSQSRLGRPERLKYWLERIDGKLAYWDESAT